MRFKKALSIVITSTTEDGYVVEELPAVGDAKIRTGY